MIDWSKYHLPPREKALKYGFGELTDQELLAIIIRTGTAKHTVFDVAQQMLTNINGLENLADFPMQQLLEIAGIGVSKALQLGACFELIKRINIKSNQKKHIYFYNITDVVTFMKPYVSNLRVETFFLLLFNKHGKLIKFISLYVGTDSMIVIAPKEIFYHVIINKASKIACVHNHPNQNPFPSPNDEHITKQLKNIADIMHIGWWDHLIMTDAMYFSFEQATTFKITNVTNIS